VFELGTDGPKTILVGVDGSDTSLRAAAYAAGMARRQGSELVALFVHTVGGMASMRAESITAVRQINVEAVAELRAAIKAQADHLGFRGTVVEREGNPALEIVRLAEELRVDAVVVGASTHAGHRLVGSLAVHLVKQAQWPVTVVP